MHKHQPTHQHTHATLSQEVAVCWSEDYREETTERMINNSETLPSPLRSSAGSRRACRKQDSRGGGEQREKAARTERKPGAREKRGREKRERLEHEKPWNNMVDVAGSAKPNTQQAVSKVPKYLRWKSRVNNFHWCCADTCRWDELMQEMAAIHKAAFELQYGFNEVWCLHHAVNICKRVNVWLADRGCSYFFKSLQWLPVFLGGHLLIHLTWYRTHYIDNRWREFQ